MKTGNYWDIKGFSAF